MRKNDDIKSGRGFAAAVIEGLAASVLSVLIVLAVCAALISSGKTPESATGMIVCLSAFLGSLAGAAVAAKTYGSRALAIGLTVPGVMFAVILIGGAFSERGGIVGPVTPGLLIALLAGGILGSVLVSRKKGRRRT